MPLHVTVINSVSRVTGNFNVSGYNARYIWSGVATTWTGTLGGAAALSGAQMVVHNVATGAPLFLTGSVLYGLNYTVQPQASVQFWSDGATWLPLS